MNEATSSLTCAGGALRYMLNHWSGLTLFLRQAGAPLDNNICERTLCERRSGSAVIRR